MRNGSGQLKPSEAWEFFIKEAKVRLVDSKTAQERQEWRRTIRSLEILRNRNVQLRAVNGGNHSNTFSLSKPQPHS